jgi:large conductance mechanosensitive channel
MNQGGLKAFLLRGNVVDLAVAVVMGAVFGAVVTSFVNDVLMQVVAAVVGQPDFSGLAVSLGGTPVYYGRFLNAVITFVLVGVAVYYLVVVPLGRLQERLKREEPAAPATKACPECLSEIPAAARRCAFCGSPQGRSDPGAGAAR